MGNDSLNESIIVFDTETTGNDTGKDHIVEITIQYGLGESAEIKTRRIKPLIPISKEAIAVHGITMEDVKDCPTFSQLAKGFREIFDKAETIIGYNVKFDIEILQAELIRAGLSPLNLASKKIVDPYCLWRHYEKRNLSSAYQRFVGGTFENAHSAEADVKATTAVLHGMINAFGLKDVSFEELSELTYPKEWVGYSHHIQWDKKIPVFKFGKLSSKPVWDSIQNDRSYADWIIKTNFPPHIKEICLKASELSKDEFMNFIHELYGKPLEDEEL